MYEFKSCRSRKVGKKSQAYHLADELTRMGQAVELRPGLVMRGRSDQAGLKAMFDLDYLRAGHVNSARAVRSAVFRHDD